MYLFAVNLVRDYDWLMNFGFDMAVLLTLGKSNSSYMSELAAYLMLCLSVLSFDVCFGDPDCLVIISLRRFCYSLSLSDSADEFLR